MGVRAGLGLFGLFLSAAQPAQPQIALPDTVFLSSHVDVQRLLSTDVVQMDLMPNDDPVGPPILKEGKRFFLHEWDTANKLLHTALGNPTIFYAFVEKQDIKSDKCMLEIHYEGEAGSAKSDIKIRYTDIDLPKIFSGGDKVYIYGKSGRKAVTTTRKGDAKGIMFTMQDASAARTLAGFIAIIAKTCAT